jgi:hypothetical protein
MHYDYKPTKDIYPYVLYLFLTFSSPSLPLSLPKIDIVWDNLVSVETVAIFMMGDILLILTIVLFFITSFGFLGIVERLMRR